MNSLTRTKRCHIWMHKYLPSYLLHIYSFTSYFFLYIFICLFFLHLFICSLTYVPEYLVIITGLSEDYLNCRTWMTIGTSKYDATVKLAGISSRKQYALLSSDATNNNCGRNAILSSTVGTSNFKKKKLYIFGEIHKWWWMQETQRWQSSKNVNGVIDRFSKYSTA